MRSFNHPSLKGPLVMGIHAIRELLLHVPNRVIRVYIQESESKRKSDLILQCKQNLIPISFVEQKMLEQIVFSESHQGVVAQIRERVFPDPKEFFSSIASKKQSLLVMADQILDPQNLGAVIRNAECLGADAVIWSKNRGSDITPVVAKASCGASELLPLLRVSNLADTVSKLQQEGFDAVVAAASPIAQSAYTFTFAPKTLLVVGSEGEGVQPLIQKKADQLIYIPMAGKIESLNVSSAASILISLYASQHPSK